MRAVANREERLQIMLEADELRAVDDFRYKYRLPSRAAAVRELLKRGAGEPAIRRGGRWLAFPGLRRTCAGQWQSLQGCRRLGVEGVRALTTPGVPETWDNLSHSSMTSFKRFFHHFSSQDAYGTMAPPVP